jgi:acetyl esterase
MSTKEIVRHQRRPVPDNALTRLLLGATCANVSSRELAVSASEGQLAVRVYQPSPNRATAVTVLYIHGGGWALGDQTMGAWLCSRVARDLEASVVSVGYRLAPEHPFPAALEDCLLVLEKIATGELDGVYSGPILVMGDSAGGNLAAVLCHTSRNQSGPPIAHQTLIYPATDLRPPTEVPSTRSHPVISTADVEAYRRWYLGTEGEPEDPRLSPSLASSLAGLPPALVIVAGHDPLHDEGKRYAAALDRAGVDVRLANYPSMPHGFVGFPRFCNEAAGAQQLIVSEQRQALKGG